MARLAGADVERLLAALRGDEAGSVPSAARMLPSERSSEATMPPGVAKLIESARSVIATAAADGTLTQRIEASLSGYVRSVRCAVAPMPAGESISDALLFLTESKPALALEIDAGLGGVLGDVLIGGDGTTTKHSKRARLGRLLEPFAGRVLAAIAAAAELPAVGSARFTGAADATTPLASGSLGVGAHEGAWRALALIESSTQSSEARMEPSARTSEAWMERSTRSGRLSEPTDRQEEALEPLSPSARVGPSAFEERVARTTANAPQPLLGVRPTPESERALASAVESASAQLSRIARCESSVAALQTARVETPVLPRGDLKLALIAGGQGPLVVSADRAAVASIAAAAVGVEVASAGEPGPVVIDAVEAVLRAALRGFAERLPGAAAGPQRFVRLAEGALPARSPHYAVVAPLVLGERTATLQWLVPVSMAGADRTDGD